MYEIRPMKTGDVAEVAALDNLVNPSPWSEEQFRKELHNPHSDVDLLMSGQQVAAYICCWQVADELEIQNVATAPPFRRCGYAARLLQFVVERAVGNRIRKVLLEVRAGNGAARALYEKFNFKGSGYRKNYYADNEDALLMELDLTCLNKQESGLQQ